MRPQLASDTQARQSKLVNWKKKNLRLESVGLRVASERSDEPWPAKVVSGGRHVETGVDVDRGVGVFGGEAPGVMWSEQGEPSAENT